MRVLVTGATGFIGRRVMARLADDSRFDPVAASRARPDDWPAGLEHHAVDLLAPGAPSTLLAAVRPTHLLHLAWTATPGRFWTDPDNLDWSAATLSLFSAFAAQGGKRAVMAGSCAEYAWTGDPTLRESAAPAPATLYGIAKDATRRQVCAAGEAAGVGVAWGRVFWLYGPAEAPGRLVSDVARALVRGQTVDTSEGRQARDFLHVDDVAGAFTAALTSDWRGAFNIGSGHAVPVRTVVELLAAAGDRGDLVRFGARPTPAGDPPRLEADIRILRDEIGFSPAIALERGLAETYAWWCQRVPSGELDANGAASGAAAAGDTRRDEAPASPRLPAAEGSLATLLLSHAGKAVDKWEQYIEVYERELGPLRARGKPVRLLEVGVQNGGSLELWDDYLPAGSTIVGIDIDPKVASLEFGSRRIRVEIVDVMDVEGLEKVLAGSTFDAIIDDGSHRCSDVSATFARLFDHLADGGLYVIEDLHCSYYAGFGGGFEKTGSSIEYLKHLIDCLNNDHIADGDVDPSRRPQMAYWNSRIARIAFYDSLAVVEKLGSRKLHPYRRVLSGTSTLVQPYANWIADHPPARLRATLFGSEAAKRFELAFLEQIQEERRRSAEAKAMSEEKAARAARALSRKIRSIDKAARTSGLDPMSADTRRRSVSELKAVVAAQDQQIAALRQAIVRAGNALAAAGGHP